MSKSIGIDVTSNLGIFGAIVDKWPALKYGLMAEIGYQGRQALRDGYLRGQVIDLRKYPHDKRGRRTVTYAIARNRKSVKIASYPLNLYKPREVYASAAGPVTARIEAALRGYDERVLQKRLDDLDKARR